MRSGVEVWMEQEDTLKLQAVLERLNGKHVFINFLEETFNTADLVGIFKAETMSEHTHRKNGQWHCNSGQWHDRGQKCECLSKTEKETIATREDAIKNCTRRCTNGMLVTQNNGMMYCECIKPFIGK